MQNDIENELETFLLNRKESSKNKVINQQAQFKNKLIENNNDSAKQINIPY